MSRYGGDSRVRIEPVCGSWHLVKTTFFGEVAVVKGDDGIHRVFEYERARVGSVHGVRLGDELDVPEGDFDLVVHALIGDPQ